MGIKFSGPTFVNFLLLPLTLNYVLLKLFENTSMSAAQTLVLSVLIALAFPSFIMGMWPAVQNDLKDPGSTTISQTQFGTWIGVSLACCVAMTFFMFIKHAASSFGSLANKAAK